VWPQESCSSEENRGPGSHWIPSSCVCVAYLVRCKPTVEQTLGPGYRFKPTVEQTRQHANAEAAKTYCCRHSVVCADFLICWGGVNRCKRTMEQTRQHANAEAAKTYCCRHSVVCTVVYIEGWLVRGCCRACGGLGGWVLPVLCGG
jgi:hypothetical protein